MKKIISTLLTVCLTLAVSAQEEVALTDTILQPFCKLIVEAGWEVHLIQNDSPVSTIAIIVPEEELPTAGSTYLSSYSKNKLTILRNTSLPEGTVVELSGRLRLEELTLKENATVMADRYVAKNEKGNGTLVHVGENATLHIRHLVTATGCDAVLWSSDYAQTIIDTISGEDFHINLQRDDRFYYGVNQLNGTLAITEEHPHYEKYYPDGLSANPCQPWRLEDTTQHIAIFKHHQRTWSYQVSAGLLVGYRFGELSPSAINSPYASDGTLTCNIPLITDFKLSDKWSLRTGLMLSLEYAKLYHQVTLEDGILTIADGRTPMQKNSFFNTYLGIPATIYFTPHPEIGSRSVSFGADVRISRLIGSTFSNTPDIFLSQKLRPQTGAFNPWRIELGLNLTTNAIGIIHGVRLYTNLLPEFRSKETGKSLHSLGLEVTF
ncbi:MAG: hypothetical protein J5641_06265 [Bacteroidales bacterium]|nr:hypothetical protein [Bacteroidales bacterium]